MTESDEISRYCDEMCVINSVTEIVRKGGTGDLRLDYEVNLKGLCFILFMGERAVVPLDAQALHFDGVSHR
jgi:hypothetical protein